MLYLHCERCHVRRLFLAVEESPPFDFHSSCCSTCGFSYGYAQQEEFENGRIVVVSRPVLSDEMVRAARAAYVTEDIERLRAVGTTVEREKARRELEQVTDLAQRRALTTPARPAGLDPALAANVLAPKGPPVHPRNRDGR
jgi:hypothetical protein